MDFEMKNTYYLFLALSLFFPLLAKSQSTPQDLVFKIAVSVSSAPAAVHLSWNKQVGVSSYKVMRKTRNEKTFTTIADNLPLNDTFFTDLNVVNGSAFEYSVQSSINNNITGYVYAGINLEAVHQAGEVLVVIDETYKNTAAAEIETFKLDLIKEGWKVSTAYVARSLPVSQVKQIILNRYQANQSNFKGVILLGHVAVPYSGNIAPDAHSDHYGAWPADMYYSDMSTSNSMWTDVSTNIVTASDARNHNIVGDGKFDMSSHGSACDMKIFVGRVDVYNMGYISNDDTYLFKQYLAKNHSYRSGEKKFRQEGVVDDHFGFKNGEAFAQNGWRNLSSLVGPTHVSAGDYMTSMKSNSYIWSYGCGGGWTTGATGIGTTNDFKSSQIEGVFTMLYGSYFGDWDSKNNFLRAPLASPSSTLVSVWGGRPNWFFHTMAMGEPIGYSYLNSIDNQNTYLPRGFFADQVHQALLGDPSLKMYMMDAPRYLSALPINNGSQVHLNWAPSNDPDVLGYYVYRANTLDEEFQLLTPNYISEADFIDYQSNAANGMINAFYMVKAVRLEHSTTGTFYNLSPAAIVDRFSMAVPLPVNLLQFNGLTHSNLSNELWWEVSDETKLAGYQIQVSEDQDEFIDLMYIKYTPSNVTRQTYHFIDEHPKAESYYRLKMIDLDGKINYSDIVYLRHALPEKEISFFPNPCTERFTLSYPSENTTTLQIQIFSLNGQMMKSVQKEIQIGENRCQFDEIKSWPSGIYFVRVSDETIGNPQLFKILKN
jgi:hypothetical protein